MPVQPAKFEVWEDSRNLPSISRGDYLCLWDYLASLAIIPLKSSPNSIEFGKAVD
jgi:hypothetical protein